MKIQLLYLGKKEKGNLNAAITDYESRIKHYLPFEIVPILPVKYNPGESLLEKKSKESEKLSHSILPSDIVILLDEAGKELTSHEFSAFLGKQLVSTGKKMIFIIGGPFGFDARIRSRANGVISFSKMTFPHQMIRLFFVEQLYRALTILHHEPYHHE
jgi:23S rRNA (pseudouridine1915-N3)-methyltransferase